jgi:hypothetical protein
MDRVVRGSTAAGLPFCGLSKNKINLFLIATEEGLSGLLEQSL